MKKSGYLALADGTVFSGTYLGQQESVVGEAVFSTATTGYVEILSDPSFYGQIVVLSQPEVGNYGVALQDLQSNGIKISALVVKNLSSRASSFRSDLTLTDWLMRENIPVLYDVDTRALVTHLRDNGAMMAAMGAAEIQKLYCQAKEAPGMAHTRLSPFVSVKVPCEFRENLRSIDGQELVKNDERYKLVVLDFGCKKELLRYFYNLGCEVVVLPSDSTSEQIWAQKPDGVFLSNGPGDPACETRAVATIKNILGKIPIFGVCLGHQILGQALNMSTYKLKFGHRGSNQPVKMHDERIWITAQNHGFAVTDDENIAAQNCDKNISDASNEGINLPHLWAFSVQFHPEGAPGPKDGENCFSHFLKMMDDWKKTVVNTRCPGEHVRGEPFFAEHRDHRQ